MLKSPNLALLLPSLKILLIDGSVVDPLKLSLLNES